MDRRSPHLRFPVRQCVFSQRTPESEHAHAQSPDGAPHFAEGGSSASVRLFFPKLSTCAVFFTASPLPFGGARVGSSHPIPGGAHPAGWPAAATAQRVARCAGAAAKIRSSTVPRRVGVVQPRHANSGATESRPPHQCRCQQRWVRAEQSSWPQWSSTGTGSRPPPLRPPPHFRFWRPRQAARAFAVTACVASVDETHSLDTWRPVDPNLAQAASLPSGYSNSDVFDSKIYLHLP